MLKYIRHTWKNVWLLTSMHSCFILFVRQKSMSSWTSSSLLRTIWTCAFALMLIKNLTKITADDGLTYDYLALVHMFENHSKCCIWNFGFWAFSTNFWPIKTDLSCNTVLPQALGFQKLAKMDHFGIFNELLSTKIVTQLASLAMLYETFSVIFKHCEKTRRVE